MAHYGLTHPRSRLAIVAPTFADARDTCVEGESGILNVIPEALLRGGSRDKAWNRSIGELWLRNGTRYRLFSSEKPDRLRGPQHHRAWLEELAAWIYLRATWDQVMFGLRLGNNPQAVITTTPKPKKLIKELIKTPPAPIRITKGHTKDNAENLAPTFLRTIVTKYQGTRLGRQELAGEILDDVEGALWKRDQIDELRLPEIPSDPVRLVVGVDPAVTAKSTSNETGIVVAALAQCRCLGQAEFHGFVLHDGSLKGSPDQWAKQVNAAYSLFRADRVVGEVNNGGDLVEHTIRTVNPSIAYKSVTASRGKVKRAEPIAALYEQHRVHHIGASFTELEDQMCQWVPAPEPTADRKKTDEATPDGGDDDVESPDRMDALVWALTELFEGSQATAWAHQLAPPCPKCGFPNIPGAPVCMHCGGSLGVPTDGETPPKHPLVP